MFSIQQFFQISNKNTNLNYVVLGEIDDINGKNWLFVSAIILPYPR